MPQLSPLNWILLFILYWWFLYSLTVIFWWNKSNCMSIFIKKLVLKPHKWIWK